MPNPRKAPRPSKAKHPFKGSEPISPDWQRVTFARWRLGDTGYDVALTPSVQGRWHVTGPSISSYGVRGEPFRTRADAQRLVQRLVGKTHQYRPLD
jgi:hypothetical protein